ncbi:hypothetical protein LA76x_0409 [Lysobacter antibioticus]|uniref:Uncharacterized protein n=1 Tax=Lysobacter antibioticus TaxID=84531 RepID=A0A0S2F4U5_LYSAN|nr:hypothetical protein LA76x_0409 [Lysobacter antibioticus]
MLSYKWLSRRNPERTAPEVFDEFGLVWLKNEVFRKPSQIQ